jgi:hypothetical protein
MIFSLRGGQAHTAGLGHRTPIGREALSHRIAYGTLCRVAAREVSLDLLWTFRAVRRTGAGGGRLCWAEMVDEQGGGVGCGDSLRVTSCFLGDSTEPLDQLNRTWA